MIKINMPMPKTCGECFALDDHWDYPFCLINHGSRGYNFNIHTQRMESCPLIPVNHDDINDHSYIDRIMRGLECQLNPDSRARDVCLHHRNDNSCRYDVLKDALHVLNHYKTRVLTIHDIAEYNECRDAIYLEAFANNEVLAAIVKDIDWNAGIDGVCTFVTADKEIKHDFAHYNRYWRCWNEWPSSTTRSEAKWE